MNRLHEIGLRVHARGFAMRCFPASRWESLLARLMMLIGRIFLAFAELLEAMA